MDSRRLILFLIFSFAIIMMWDSWLQSSRPAPDPVAEVVSSPAEAGAPTPSGQLRADGSQTPVLSAAEDTSAALAPTMRVRTDLVEATISASGGDLVHLKLLQHLARKGQEDRFVLFEQGARHIYTAQTGLIGEGLPTHRSRFRLPAEELDLAPGQDRLEVRLEAEEVEDVRVTKVLAFERGSYIIEVRYEIENLRAEALSPDAYFQLVRDSKSAEEVDIFGVNMFTGPAIFTDAEKFQKVSFEDILKGQAKHATRADDGWVAMIQHYFVSAWLPSEGLAREYFTRRVGSDLFSAGAILPVAAIPPGGQATILARLYAGPQEQDKLSVVAPGLELVVDYGWLTVIAAPLAWVLHWFHKLVGNWGWAIILVTVSIKLIFFPLSAASYKSMAKLRALAPRMQRMKEVYGHDKVRMQQEMMTLYRTEKINPLGGCLPILVQIPVFIALYWVLLASVEMRHAPWLGWIQDLSAKDPYFILPIVMGLSMIVQMKLNPPPPDPMQAKIMMALPVVFTFMFLWFPSGLVLYWVVNNLLSIAQQWHITRAIEAATKKSSVAKSQ